MKIHLLSFCTLAVLLTACSPRYSYFTKELYEKENWSQNEIMKIQFYNSRDIVLSRAMKSGETSIQGGKIRIKNGQRVEQVVIKAGTPGVAVLMPKEDRFAISFEDDDNAYLMFGPNPKNGNRFALLAQEWTREAGKIHYRGKVYEADASSAYASLMVDLKRSGSHQYETHKAQGRMVRE